MKILKFVLLFLLALIGFNKKVIAQIPGYRIENLDLKLTIQKDYSLLAETIVNVNFTEKSHGIVWYIPDSSKDGIKILSITDGKGEILPYKIVNFNLDKKIIIGDQNKTVLGKQTYRIKYLGKNVAKDMINHMEIWWNLVEENRDVQIEKISTIIDSPYYKIIDAKGIKDIKIENNRVFININSPIQPTDDLMIKTSFEKSTSFQTRDELQKLLDDKKTILNTSLIALVMIFVAWLIRKRN